ncbi:ATP-binding protein [Vibrio campbellii]|uniref:AAA family ATPase n=1 Tax=Vibrio campbellii TaxID=680 RepID=UPI001D176874|nr:AAA family ATPase [Vibrio campbellii]MCC4226257.1 ATP-binding protein [Vibrio campbellii]
MKAQKSRVTSLMLEGYKSFHERQEIDLKGLTLIFGYNNSGKSALVRSIPFLADSFKRDTLKFYTKSYLDYSSEAIRGGVYRDIKNHNSKRITFGMKWNDSVDFNFSLTQEGDEPERITKFELSKDGQKSIYIPTLADLDTFESSEHTVSFKSFNSIENEELRTKLLNFSHSVFWISSMRTPPKREFEVGLGIPLGIDQLGNGVGEMIWHLSSNNSQSFEDINSWLKDTCGRVIDTNSPNKYDLNGRRIVRLETMPAGTDSNSINIPIIDSGEGIAQALPVVTLCAMAANNELGDAPIIVVEQPELHLHPKATVAMARFIVDCINKNEGMNIILETHSESFLLALQMAIIDKKLSLNSFSAYWIDKCKETNFSDVKSIGIDEEGFLFGSLPQSVFRETLSLSRELIEKRRSK